MTLNQKHLQAVYGTYSRWRRDQGAIDPAWEGEVFAREMARLALSPLAKILEVGFGEGRFLDWARDNGFEMEGIEILDDYVSAARGRGHNVSRRTIAEIASSGARSYDAIVCFDVLEHLSADEIMDFFGAAARLLDRNGVILTRFPNGGSPFGRFYQHSDATHRTALTALKVDQLALPAGLRVTGAFNAARAMRAAPMLGLTGRGAALIATLAEWLVGKIYIGARIPLDPNLVVHIRHGPGSRGDGKSESEPRTARQTG